MSFSDILQGLTSNVKGAKGAFIVGMDGIIVEEYNLDGEIDMQSIGAEYGNILKEVQNASASLKLGVAREVTILTEAASVIIRKINEEYLVAMIIAPGGNYGKGRFMTRVASVKLEPEFS
jgi:predicted regulator of Ras-like GTPase activity (Roadblock/LC7/MglB family)